MRTHVFKDHVDLTPRHGRDRGFDVLISYAFAPGEPTDRDDPGSPDVIDILGVTISGCVATDAPNWLVVMLEADEVLAGVLADHAREQNASDRDEARFQAMRDEGRELGRAA